MCVGGRGMSHLLANSIILFMETERNDIFLNSVSPEDEVQWYPKEKIEYVKRKLRGDNPVCISR